MGAERSEAPAATATPRIEVGERFPTVAARLVGGGDLILPDDVEGDWAVVLLYRGHWCPYCRQQLLDFQRNLDRFQEADVRVAALSSDPESEALATVEQHGIEFPVAYGLDPLRMRETLGTYLAEDATFIQATGFVLRPGGRIALAVYSSGAVGRLVADDVLGLVEYARSQDAADA